MKNLLINLYVPQPRRTSIYWGNLALKNQYLLGEPIRKLAFSLFQPGRTSF